MRCCLLLQNSTLSHFFILNLTAHVCHGTTHTPTSLVCLMLHFCLRIIGKLLKWIEHDNRTLRRKILRNSFIVQVTVVSSLYSPLLFFFKDIACTGGRQNNRSWKKRRVRDSTERLEKLIFTSIAF